MVDYKEKKTGNKKQNRTSSSPWRYWNEFISYSFPLHICEGNLFKKTMIMTRKSPSVSPSYHHFFQRLLWAMESSGSSSGPNGGGHSAPESDRPTFDPVASDRLPFDASSAAASTESTHPLQAVGSLPPGMWLLPDFSVAFSHFY